MIWDRNTSWQASRSNKGNRLLARRLFVKPVQPGLPERAESFFSTGDAETPRRCCLLTSYGRRGGGIWNFEFPHIYLILLNEQFLYICCSKNPFFSKNGFLLSLNIFVATRIYWCWLSLVQRSRIIIFDLLPHFGCLFSKFYILIRSKVVEDVIFDIFV